MFLRIIKSEISEYHTHEVEWTIQNIFSYVEVGESVSSHTFSFLDAEWCLKLYPNGKTINNSKGWLGLYLRREDACTSPKSIHFDFGIKKCDETVETSGYSEIKYVFEKEHLFCGYPKWIKKSGLLARKFQLAPSGNLTITCNIRAKASLETTPGQQELCQDLKDMFLSSKGCDAILKLRNEEFPVHRSILASRSPVFKAMFEADMRENNTGVLHIVDCHAKAFKDFLVFIYSGKFEYSSDEFFELYSIAHKYDVERLKSNCVTFILANLTAENVVDAYAIGHRYCKEELKKKSQHFFDENVAEIISNDKWDSLVIEKPIFVNMLLKGIVKNSKNKKIKFS